MQMLKITSTKCKRSSVCLSIPADMFCRLVKWKVCCMQFSSLNVWKNNNWNNVKLFMILSRSELSSLRSQIFSAGKTKQTNTLKETNWLSMNRMWAKRRQSKRAFNAFYDLLSILVNILVSYILKECICCKQIHDVPVRDSYTHSIVLYRVNCSSFLSCFNFDSIRSHMHTSLNRTDSAPMHTEINSNTCLCEFIRVVCVVAAVLFSSNLIYEKVSCELRYWTK